MDSTATWRRLCELIDDDAAVLAAVEDAVDGGEDPWEALLDGLDDAGALAYLQADDSGMELADALAQLPRIFALQPDLDEVTDTDDLDEAATLADALLRGEGLRLVRLVEDDESWPIVVVDEEAVVELSGTAQRLGHEIVVGVVRRA